MYGAIRKSARFCALITTLFGSFTTLAADRCNVELESLKSLAASYDVRFQSDDVIAAGDPIKIAWSGNGGKWPEGVSAWLVVVSIDDVRYAGTGFYPLPGGSPGPLDIEFAEKWMRAIVPQHTLDAPSSGQFAIKPYREGNFGLSWTVIAKSDCGEMQLRNIGAYRIAVEARHARIVVQDLYDYSRPQSVIQSLDGRYEMRVFDDYYQVFDRRSGGKVLDRRGRCPDFSPTGRFVASLAGRSDGKCDFNTAGENKPKFEVIDLVSGDLVANPNPPAVWAEGDAFLIVASKWWKMLQGVSPMISLLVDDDAGRARELLAIPELGKVSIDVANGYAYLIDEETKPGAAYSLGGNGEVTKHQSKWDESRNDWIWEGVALEELIAAITRSTGSPPETFNPDAHPAVELSHIRYIDDPGAVFSDVAGDDASRLFAKAVNHPEPEGELLSESRDDPVLTASLLRGANVLASARKAGRTIEGLVGEYLDTIFNPQFDVANPLDRVTGRMWEIDAMDIPNDEKRKTLNEFRAQTVLPVIDKLIGEIDPAFDILSLRLGCWPNGGAIYVDNLSGIWRHEGGGRTVWLTHAGCMGIGTVGNLALNHVDLFIKAGNTTRHLNLLFDRRFYCSGNDVECEYVEVDGNNDGDELTTTEQGFGSLIPVGDAVSDVFGARIPQDFHQLIEFDSLLPVFVDDRYLLLPIGKQMFIVDLERETLAGPHPLVENAAGSRFSLSRDRRNLLQASADGGLAIYDFSSGDVLLNGRYVDDELIIYDRYGHYLSTFEGAQYVHMRFVGRPEIYSLARMASSLNRPDLVRAALHGTSPVDAPDMSAPPRLEATLLENEGSAMAIGVKARAQAGLKALRLYSDGTLLKSVELDAAEWEGELAIDNPANSDWLTIVAVDQNGFESAEEEIRLPQHDAGRGRLYVIAIGTDIYDRSDRLSRLEFAGSDARNFANAVNAAASERYEQVNIVGPFVDSETLGDDLQSALDSIAAQSAPGDTVMVFVAGHGIRSDAGQFYLATRTTSLEDLDRTGLSWQVFAEKLAELNTRTFIFIDACHSGSVGEATNDGAADALLSAASGSVTVIAASKGRQYSLESPSAGGGYFTSALASIVSRRNDPAVDRDDSGTLDLDELYLALKRQVVESTGGRQTPWIARSQVVGKTPLF